MSNIDDYLQQLANEASFPKHLQIPPPKRLTRIQKEMLIAEQRRYRMLAEAREQELTGMEHSGYDTPALQKNQGGSGHKTGLYYKASRCDDGHHHNIHTHDVELIVGKVYNLSIANHHHDGCYTITEQHGHEGLHADVISGPHDDCSECG